LKINILTTTLILCTPPPLISCEAAQTGKILSFSLPPPPLTRPEMKDFVAGLARALKDIIETKILTDQACSNKSLSRIQIYQIIKKIKYGKNTAGQRHSNPIKNKHTDHLVTAAAAAIEESRRQTALGFASVHAYR
jgi:hypothetical protein